MSNQSRFRDLPIKSSKKQQHMSEQRKHIIPPRTIPKARIGGQRAARTPSQPHAQISTPVATEVPNNDANSTEVTQNDANATEVPNNAANATEHSNSEQILPPPSLVLLKRPRKLPPVGPDGRYLLTLIGGNTFDYSELVSTRIHQIFKERSFLSGSSWKNLSIDETNFYFGELKKSFAWDASVEVPMKTAWEKLARKRYSEYLSRMRRAWKRDPCVPIEIWNKWCETWSEPAAVAKSDQSRVNRKGGTNGPAKPTHTGGSVSARTSAQRLEEQLGCPPTLAEVFRYLHTKNRDGKTFIDDKSRMTNENITRLREEFGLDEVDGDEIFLEAVGGKDKKRRIYGIGSLAAQVSSNHGGNPSSQNQSNSVNASLQLQLDELKEELAREREERKQLSIRLEEALNSGIIPTHTTSTSQE